MLAARRKKKQLIHRLPADFVRGVLSDFNTGSLDALGVAHLVAPTPQAKGKIERRFGTFQNRTKQRSNAQIPLDVWDEALPDLHFSPRATRKVNNDQTIDFEERNCEIATTSRKSVTIIHHPNLKFWVVDHPPEDIWPPGLWTFDP